MIDKEKADPVKVSALKRIALQFNGVDSACQRDCLKAAFPLYPSLNTVEIRDHLGILHPAGRIKELREEGHLIRTVRVTLETENRAKHRIGLYLWAPVASATAEAVRHA
jgi:Helix-turn-helix domain